MLDRLSLRARRALCAWAFLGVPIVFYATIRFYPAADALLTSLTDWNIVGARRFVGLDNYRRLFADPTFWKVMGNTFQYLIVGVTVSLGLSFLVAYLLDGVRFGHALLRALYFVPHVTTAVAMAWVWRWLYQPVPIGVFNGLLVWAGLPQQPFLRSTEQALYAVLAPAIWAGLGFQIVVFLAGLKAIPQEYYEAAAIDGAGAWRSFWAVTLPLLNPQLVMVSILELIFNFKIFDQVYATTQGGPAGASQTVIMLLYDTAFKYFRLGDASVMAVFVFGCLLLVTLGQWWLFRREVEH
jgi:multiple sugar transport system permease protein